MIDAVQFRWLAKCALAAASILLVCATARAWLPIGMHAPATSARDGSIVSFNRYLTEKTPDVVLLGSSLTARIREEYFDTLQARNLAIGGGSPLTGLRIILNNQQKLPKIIFIETNLLSMGADEMLIHRYSTPGHDFFFRPIRLAVAAYENWRHAPASRKESIMADARLANGPPQEYDNKVYIDRVAEGFGQSLSNSLQNNINQLAELISSARLLGIRVSMFELPYVDQLDQARLVQDTRRLVSSRFHAQDDWLDFVIDRTELRWPDGLHMDERSAILVARAIERAVNAPGGGAR